METSVSFLPFLYARAKARVCESSPPSHITHALGPQYSFLRIFVWHFPFQPLFRPKEKMIRQCFASPHSVLTRLFVPSQSHIESAISSSSSTTRRALSLSLVSTTFYSLIFSVSPSSSTAAAAASSKSTLSDFFELQDSGGVKALDLLVGSGEVPADGDQVSLSVVQN